MINNSIKVGIDVSILERIEKVMPSYQHKKAFVNLLLDEALTKLEIELANKTAPVQ